MESKTKKLSILQYTLKSLTRESRRSHGTAITPEYETTGHSTTSIDTGTFDRFRVTRHIIR